MRWISLICWIGLCFAVAGVSGSWTASAVPGWYRTLTRPAIAPPDWVFGPAWTLLYALMAVAAWRIWESPASPLRTWGLALFLVQLILNFAWSLIFFRHHAIGATTLVFGRVSPAAAWLMAPYWAWVTFATVLNAAFWRLN